MVLTVLFDLGVRFIERRTVVWQTARRRDSSREPADAIVAVAPAA